MALDYEDLNDADKAIIEELRQGRNIPSNIAGDLNYTREYVSSRLKRLREHEIARSIGGGVHELVEENVPTEDIAESGSSEGVFDDYEPTDAGETDAVEAESEFGAESNRTDTEAKEDIYDGLAEQIEVEQRVWDVVEDVAEGWDDDDRLHNRKQAAAEVLQHAVETGEPVGRSSEIVEELREKYPVAGQNEETYWRKNVRDVLSEVGDYSRGSHKYTVSTLDQDGENDG